MTTADAAILLSCFKHLSFGLPDLMPPACITGDERTVSTECDPFTRKGVLTVPVLGP
jgi:hypothetical protein